MNIDPKRRIRNLKSELKKLNIDAMLVTGSSNVSYLSGFTGHDSWLIVGPSQNYLITDSRYTEQARKQCRHCKVIERKNSLSSAAAEALNKIESIKVAGIEDDVRLDIYKLVRRKLNSRLIAVKQIVEKLRQVKDDQEIAFIRKAGDIAINALRLTLEQIKCGMSECHLAAMLDYNIQKQSSKPGFDTIVAFGENASQPHYQPGAVKLKKNDTILIDFGARYNGYTCDITRCFAFGKANKKYITVYEAVLEAQQAAIAKIAAGVSVGEVERAARDVITKAGLPQYGHGTGHGLGLDVHEMPTVSEKITVGKLMVGQVITIEPGVYIPGNLGIRIEDDVVVTKKGCKLLTPSDFKDPKAINNLSQL